MALLHMLLAMGSIAVIALPETDNEVNLINNPPPINTPAPMLGSATQNCEQFHWVTPGQTCAKLAAYFGTSAAKLAVLNIEAWAGSWRL
jgi:hypothetical protein